MNFNKICVYDFETDGKDPHTCNPVELAAVIIDPRTLELVPDSEFSVTIKPPDIDKKDYFDKHKDTIDFHAKNSKLTPEEVVQNWKKGVEEKTAWQSFVDYLDKYHKSSERKGQFSAPLQAGMNIYRFDSIIIERLAKKYDMLSKEGINKVFHPRDKIDLMNILFLWFENSSDLESYGMDSVREYFGLQTDGAHTALKDAKDEAILISRFMKRHRSAATKTKFRGALADL